MISTASQSFSEAVVMSARSGQIAVERDTWTFVRGASSCAVARFDTLAFINLCSRSQIISWREPGAERGSDAPSKISSYGLLIHPSKAAIGIHGKRRFYLKTGLQNKLQLLVSALF
jgi:hypothetical protein